MNSVILAYHGSPHIDVILKEGLKGLHIWLALSAKDAAYFGPVIEVNLDWPQKEMAY